MRGIDAVLQEIPGGAYDIQIGPDGDILTEDTFDTAIQVSLLSDARATAGEVAESSKRRGWVGNEHTPGFEQGGKLWLFEQSRATRDVLNLVTDAARDALRWMVDDGFATDILQTEARRTENGVVLELTIQRPDSTVEHRLLELWNNTGTN